MTRLILLLSFIAIAPSIALAQAAPDHANSHAPEIAFQYNFVRSNAPPASCDCISMNGGSVSATKPMATGRYAFAFDAGFVHGSTRGYDLLLSTFTAGLRYRPAPHARWNPYGQFLTGVSHAGGSLVQGSSPAATDPPLLIAGLVGGGLDRRLNSRWSVRLVEANYFFTTFSNGVNDHQNNLRISTGLIYRFGKK
jgi:outer membrane immunogenic protein